MGKTWDGGDVAFRPETWGQVLRVLKPGAHLLAFGGTRTFARMSVAIEDAGFEIRDTMMWLYGSGFPKSHDVSKGIDKAAGAEREIVGRSARYSGGANSLSLTIPDLTRFGTAGDFITAPATPEAAAWQGWGTALKPAMELICVARKPLSERTVAANVLMHGTGALNIDGCRVAMSKEDSKIIESMGGFGKSGYKRPRSDGTFMQGTPISTAAKAHDFGRWPANVIHDGSAEVEEAFAAFGKSKSGTDTGERGTGGLWQPSSGVPGIPCGPQYGDSGSASRFFYSAKASAADRSGSKHPTVKPLALMRYLVRLVTPPGGRVLDPFAGSGTTGQAAKLEKFYATLIECEAEYVSDIKRRLDK